MIILKDHYALTAVIAKRFSVVINKEPEEEQEHKEVEEGEEEDRETPRGTPVAPRGKHRPPGIAP